MHDQLAKLRTSLMAVATSNHHKIDRALMDAEDEAGKPNPDPAEILAPLHRAVKWALADATMAKVAARNIIGSTIITGDNSQVIKRG